jgi:hypothetical protein
MKLSISQLTYDPVWYDFETGKRVDGEPGPDQTALKIRPMPRSRGKTYLKGEIFVLDGEEQLKTFAYCLVDWRGVTGADGRPLPCSEPVKENVFDFALAGIVPFVMARVLDFAAQKETQEKNS